MVGRLFPVVLMGLVACLPSVDGFQVGDGPASNDGGNGADAAPPTPGVDGSVTTGVDAGPIERICLPAPTCSDGCPMPWLLAGLQALPESPCDAAVARFSVVGEEELCICSGYETEIPRNLSALAFVPPNTIVVGSQEGELVAFDADTHARRWSKGFGVGVVSLAPYRHGDGILAVAVGRYGGSGNHSLEVFKLDDGRPLSVERDRMPGPFGASSRAEGALRSIGFSGQLLTDVDPESDGTEQYIENMMNGIVLNTVRSQLIRTESVPQHRTTVTGRLDGQSEVWAFRHPGLTPGALPAPYRCASMDCTFEDATAHPFRSSWSFAACRQGRDSTLVRMRITDQCTPVFRSLDVGPHMLIRSVELVPSRDSWAAEVQL